MITKKYVLAVSLISVVILALISTTILLGRSEPKVTSIQDLVPEISRPKNQISSILVFDAREYSQELTLTLTSLQAIINKELLNQTALYIINNPQDIILLDGLYRKKTNIKIYNFKTSNSQITDLADLLGYFKSMIKGYVYFNITEKILYPAVLNYIANYNNIIAIPYQYGGLLPSGYNFLQIYNFVNATDVSDKNDLSAFYQNQLKSFQENLAGVNIWNEQKDYTNYFDYVISQKYFSFPQELLNGFFPDLQHQIINLIDQKPHKPLLNRWNETLLRLEVPYFRDISNVSNLTFMSRPLLVTEPLNTKFTQILATTKDFRKEQQSSRSGDFNYSIILDVDVNTTKFLYQYIIPTLIVYPTYFNNVTIVIDDWEFNLLPDLMFWLINNHPLIQFMPRIKNGFQLEPIYQPGIFENETIMLEQGLVIPPKTSTWLDNGYPELLQNHFIGFYTKQPRINSTFLNLPVKQVSINIGNQDNNSVGSFTTILQTLVQTSIKSNIVFLLTGDSSFILNSLQNFRFSVTDVQQKTSITFTGKGATELFTLLT